jgi:uncharacterized membrane protein
MVTVGDISNENEGITWMGLIDKNTQKSQVKYQAFNVHQTGISTTTALIIGIVVGVGGFLIICGCVVCCYCLCFSKSKVSP